MSSPSLPHEASQSSLSGLEALLLLAVKARRTGPEPSVSSLPEGTESYKISMANQDRNEKWKEGVKDWPDERYQAWKLSLGISEPRMEELCQEEVRVC